MTDRKPTSMEWNSWIEGHITQARARGEFDNLPGAGKPIPDLDKAYEESWWVKKFMAREDVSWLPETLQVRRDAERLDMVVGKMSSERAVREYVVELNVRIRRVNTGFAAGPATSVAPVEEDAVIREWRDARNRRSSPTSGRRRADEGECRRRVITAAVIAAQAGIAGGMVAALM